MKRNRTAAFLLPVLAVFPILAHAEPFVRGEIKVLASMEMPFGGEGSDSKKLKLGLAVDFVRTAPTYSISHRTSQTREPVVLAISLIDIRIDALSRKWDRFRVGGADALAYTTHLNADGSTTTEAEGLSMEAKWWIGGLLGVGVLAWAANTHDPDAACDPLASGC